MNELSAVALCLRAWVEARNRVFSPLKYSIGTILLEMNESEGRQIVVSQEDQIYGSARGSGEGAYMVLCVSVYADIWDFSWSLCITALSNGFELVGSVSVGGEDEDGESESHDVFRVTESVNTVDQAVESITRLSKLVCAQTQFLDLFLQPKLTWQDFPLLD